MTKDTQALNTREPQEMAVAPAGLTIEQVFQAVIEKQISPENIKVMRELLAMSAEQKFATAFNALQADLPVIVASSVIPHRGKYERFEDVMRQIQPCLTRHGFTVSFSNDFREGRIIETCSLKHIGGHSQSNSFAVRVNAKADSETQADCKAATTAKRNALLNALNIVIRQDCLNEEEDPRMEGGNITEAQAFELERRVAMAKRDHTKFLAFAGAKSYTEIPAAKYAVLDEWLLKAERRP